MAAPPQRLNEFTFMSQWLPKEEADKYMSRCMTEIPWAPKKWNIIYTLPQLAHYYDTSKRKKAPIAVLEEIISMIEEEYQTTVSVVWCNLFQDGNHYIDWHQDQYGEHLFVLSFGSTRPVVFRHKKTKESKEYACRHGDLYYFAPSWDKAHEHCIPKDESITEKRISFAIFCQPPFSTGTSHKK